MKSSGEGPRGCPVCHTIITQNRSHSGSSLPMIKATKLLPRRLWVSVFHIRTHTPRGRGPLPLFHSVAFQGFPARTWHCGSPGSEERVPSALTENPLLLPSQTTAARGTLQTALRLSSPLPSHLQLQKTWVQALPKETPWSCWQRDGEMGKAAADLASDVLLTGLPRQPGALVIRAPGHGLEP